MTGLIVDLFAGGGGASTGIEWATRRSPGVAINHNYWALRNHMLNHPDTKHLVDDIRAVVPLTVTRGLPVDLLWASPDCRHFSRAKGGKPCNPEIRSLPWEITRWARETKPRLICVENVPEMQTWGPLDEDGKPIPERAGEAWNEWIAAFRELGYKVAWWVLHAHHYGAPTSRKRLFIVARRDGVEPKKPEPTHGPGLLPYRTAAECIDWSDLGQSIFDENGETRHKPATLRRIATGVMRYVVNAKQPFIVTCNHQGDHFRGQSVNEPFKTVTANRDAHGLVTPVLTPFVAGVGGRAAQTGDGNKSVEAPLNTTTTKNDRALVVPCLVQTSYGERAGQAPRVLDLHKPLGTCVAGGQKHALVAAFLAKHYGGVVGHGVDRSIGTVTTKDHHSTVACELGPVESAGARVVAAFLSTYYGQSVGQPVTDPMATQTTKHRHAVVTVEIDGVTYAIIDIRMRMLKPSELKLAQGFPESYVLEGTQKLQVALIGNSVPPQLADAVVRANTPSRPRVGTSKKVRIA